MRRSAVSLLAACLLTGSLGSIHAFSVYIRPLEVLLDVSRGQISMVYSLALLCLTVSVLFGYRVYGLLPAPVLAFLACCFAAVGLAIASMANSFWMLVLGYSFIFGGANGLGYGFSLYLVGCAFDRHRGLAIGTVTAVYALGATLFAKYFQYLIDAGGPAHGFTRMAIIMLGVAIVSSALLQVSRTPRPIKTNGGSVPYRKGTIILLWLGYGLGVAAGLMAIGHAAQIVAVRSTRLDTIIIGVMLITLGNALGGFIAGLIADKWPVKTLLIVLPLLSGIALAGLATAESVGLTLLCLGVTGLAYGAIIAAYPAATAIYFGVEGGARAYGQIFTAWGLAGLTAPWFAGVLFDSYNTYTVALTMAIVCSLLSASSCWLLPETRSPDQSS